LVVLVLFYRLPIVLFIDSIVVLSLLAKLYA